MTRDGALRDLIREAQSTRRTQAGTNRVRRAFSTLGLTKQEAASVHAQDDAGGAASISGALPARVARRRRSGSA